MPTSDQGPNETNPFDSSNLSSSASSIAAIAHRIQEKNDTLESEREHLFQLQQKLSDLQRQHTLKQKQMTKSRYRLLKETANATNLEMEWMERCTSNEVSKSKADQYDQEIQQLTERLAQIRKECQREEEDVFAPHLTKITIHQNTLEFNLAEKRAQKRKREEELASIRSKHQQNLEGIRRMRHDMKKMEAEVEVMASTERAEDEEIAALSMQIKATLAKRVSLRSCMEDAKERNRLANEEVINWENRLISLSSKQTHELE